MWVLERTCPVSRLIGSRLVLGLSSSIVGYTCMHGRFGDSGGKKRSSRLARTTLRRLCLREPSVFTLVLDCPCSVLFVWLAAPFTSRLAMGRFTCWLAMDPLRSLRITSSNHRDRPRRDWCQIVADSSSRRFFDVPAHVLRHGVLSRFGVVLVRRGVRACR